MIGLAIGALIWSALVIIFNWREGFNKEAFIGCFVLFLSAGYLIGEMI
jgi:hypothetical protein